MSSVSADNEGKRGRGLGRGTRSDALRNRAKVIEVAHRVFGESGPGASMREVAREAGVGLGTIYRHFPDKDALLRAVVEERFRSLVRETREAMETLPPWEAFVRIMRRMAEMMSEDRAIAGVVMAARKRSPESSDGGSVTPERDAGEELGAVLREMAERAKAAGELRKDVQERDLGLFIGGVAMSLGPPGGQTGRASGGASERPWELYLEVVLDGLRERSRGAAGM